MARDRAKDEKIGRRCGSAAWRSMDDDEEDEPQKLELDVQVTNPSACERHVTVTISRADIDRYFDDAFGEMMPTAAVPGFRIGRRRERLSSTVFAMKFPTR